MAFILRPNHARCKKSPSARYDVTLPCHAALATSSLTYPADPSREESRMTLLPVRGFPEP